MIPREELTWDVEPHCRIMNALLADFNVALMMLVAWGLEQLSVVGLPGLKLEVKDPRVELLGACEITDRDGGPADIRGVSFLLRLGLASLRILCPILQNLDLAAIGSSVFRLVSSPALACRWPVDPLRLRQLRLIDW